jgi:MoaA/NifB/PqqE/SkfB family radical SAM enzyme
MKQIQKPFDQYTSTGRKFLSHKDAVELLQQSRAKPISAHVMPTDTCNHTCAFCSVLTRAGNSLKLKQVEEFLSPLVKLGLKAVIISGGGNPILFRDGLLNFNDLVNLITGFGLQVGLITNGMPLKDFNGRKSWKTVSPETLDKFTWIRISMSGLDHPEQMVYVPDIDTSKVTLGFSYVYHDIYYDEAEKNHGKISTPRDLITPLNANTKILYGKDRLEWLTEEIKKIVEQYKPKYVRILPNCLEVDKIASRCEELTKIAEAIQSKTVFVQYKPPQSPNVCYLGYFHPVLNSDGYVYPCDACVLNAAANHSYASPWRVCKWDEVAKLYDENLPIKSLIKNPHEQCPECFNGKMNNLMEQVKHGLDVASPEEDFEHKNFI